MLACRGAWKTNQLREVLAKRRVFGICRYICCFRARNCTCMQHKRTDPANAAPIIRKKLTCLSLSTLKAWKVSLSFGSERWQLPLRQQRLQAQKSEYFRTLWRRTFSALIDGMWPCRWEHCAILRTHVLDVADIAWSPSSLFCKPPFLLSYISCLMPKWGSCRSISHDCAYFLFPLWSCGNRQCGLDFKMRRQNSD